MLLHVSLGCDTCPPGHPCILGPFNIPPNGTTQVLAPAPKGVHEASLCVVPLCFGANPGQLNVTYCQPKAVPTVRRGFLDAIALHIILQ